MTVVNNASVIFKDKNGNVGKVKAPSANDITKISTAISDVAQVVDPTSHLPINATTSSVGVVQLADSTAVAAGTSGRVVDAAQLKDAIEHVTPAGNLMTTDTAQTVTAVKTFSTLPESSVAPTTANQLVNKTYADTKADIEVASTYAEPAADKGLLFAATNCITAPGTAHTFAARGVKTGSVELYAGASVPEGYLLCNGAAVSRTTYADLFTAIGTIYGAGDGSTTFNLPDFRDRYPIGVGTNVLGTKVAEQLPNIKGHISARFNTGGGALRHIGGGAFSLGTEENVGNLTQTSSGTAASTLAYNQHTYSSVYVDSGKVYPLSLALNFIIKS